MVTRADIGTIKYPRSEGDWDYRKAVSCELVFAWQDAQSPETRAALGRVMGNVGLDLVDGQWHMPTRHGGHMIVR